MVAPYSIRNDSLNDGPYGPESDSCAIYLSTRKFGQSTFGTLKRSLGALIQMGHRTGFVNGEGDGAGVQTDIPADLADLQRLLNYYTEALENTYQHETTEQIRALSDESILAARFVSVPRPSAAVPSLVEVMAEDMAE